MSGGTNALVWWNSCIVSNDCIISSSGSE
jgi:hypothetical protein